MYARNRPVRRRGWATRGSTDGVAGGRGYQNAPTGKAKPNPRIANKSFGNRQEVKGGVRRRAAKRALALGDRTLERAGVDVNKGGTDITGREARKIKQLWQQKRPDVPATKKGPKGPSAPVGYNPLTPLTGETFDQELAAGEKLEFGEQRRQLDSERRIAGQQITNTAGYYDEYRKAVQEASGKIDAANAQAQQTVQGRTDTAYQQDMAAQQGRDAEAAAEAQRFGRPAPQTTEGYRAVEGARAMGNLNAGTLAGQRASDQTYNARREATSVLAKAEALGSASRARRGVEEDARALESKVGAWRTDRRDKTRSTERQWAAVQKEFELDASGDKTQENVARLYSNAKVKQAYLSALSMGKIAEAKKLGAKMGLETAKVYSDAKKYAADKNSSGGGGGGSSSGGSSGGSSSGGGSFTPTQVRSSRADLRNFIARGKSGKDLPVSADPLMRAAAAQILKQGGVDAATARKFKRAFGFTPKTRTTTVRRPGNAPSGNRSRGGDSSRPT